MRNRNIFEMQQKLFKINWKLKIFIYKVLYFFRLKKILFFIQKNITKRADVQIKEINFYWQYHLDFLKEFNSVKILEFGAGKSLEQNIFLSYQSRSKLDQTVIDVSNMLDIDLFNKANELIAKILNKNRRPFVRSIEDINKFYNIKYLAPYTIDEIEKAGLCFDACISSTTLEHLPINILNNIFITLKKIVKKNGIILSLIDYSDHYSHTDDEIGNLNFLQYNEKDWQKYNTPYLFQNRLRHQDFKNFFLEMNYDIIKEIPGKAGVSPTFISNKFDSKNKETYYLWGYFLIKLK